ncbi:DUF397 domain-containing protein [Streptomyces sp. NPDC059785]|uniref:DUF397 domain-containing protein n=1 Tax=unclassified Streptomyces TaxID=2593676 RepID=UPI0036590797
MNWRKSTYSGGGEGNNCLEIADLPPRIAIRDSKNPAHGTLLFPRGAFTALLEFVRGTPCSQVGRPR